MLRVQLIGPFTVFDGDGAQALAVPSGKATTLLQLLATRRGSLVSSERIMDVLWHDDPPAKAQENIASLVSRLRRAVGAERITGSRDGYRLEREDLWVDVDEAERLVVEGEHQLEASRPSLAAAAAAQARRLLEHGDFLEDEPHSTWAEEGRRGVQRLVRRARRWAWTAALELDQHRQALDIATLAVEADPLDEEAHRARMLALYRDGHAGAALAAYEQLRATLSEELGTDPGPATAQLHTTILRMEPVAGAAAQQRTPPGSRGQLVGRQDELSTLVQRWADAADGQAGLALVCGPAGIGKTRLAAELADEARTAGGLVLWAQCHAAERSLFLQPLLEAVRDLLAMSTPERATALAGSHAGTLGELLPELRPLLGAVEYQPASPEREHRRSLDALASLLYTLTCEQPVLLVGDDLHHAGWSTLEALHFLLERLRASRLLVLGTVEAGAEDDVVDALGASSLLVRPGPLTPADVDRLAVDRGVSEHAERIIELTGGHPGFVVEALDWAADPDATGSDGQAPESLREAVRERIRKAGRRVHDFLEVAAVVGATFELEAVAALAEIGQEDAADRAGDALRAGLIQETDTRFAFSSPVLREVLYDATPTPIRSTRHRRLAARLAAQPEAAAVHRAAAGDWLAACDALAAAAESAVETFSLVDARRLLTDAVDTAERAGDRRRVARLRIRRGQVREELADYEGATDDHTAALAIAQQAGDDLLEALALERLGWTAYYARDAPGARELASRAAELAESAAAAPAAGAGALVLVGRIRHWAGDIDGASAAYDDALNRQPDDATRASALSCLGALLEHADRFDEARRTLDRAAEECSRTGAFRPLLRTLFFAGLARANLGDLGGALRVLERKRRILAEYEVSFYWARTNTTLSWVWRELGDVQRALELAERAVVESRELDAGSLQTEQELHALLAVAECALMLGDEATAVERTVEAEGLLSRWMPFLWRAELRVLDVRCRLEPHHAEHLLALARERHSPKYQALALRHLGRDSEAAAAAAATGSDLLLAEVAPPAQAEEALERVRAHLPSELRASFAKQGRLAAGLGRRT